MPWLDAKLNWNPNQYYNAEDLNRVENNTVEVAQLIKQLIGVNVNLEPTVMNRDYSRIEFEDSLNRVERNIEKINCFNLNGWEQPKTTWQAGDGFSYLDANRMEKNLNIYHEILSRNINTVVYCGTFNCGEGVI